MIKFYLISILFILLSCENTNERAFLNNGDELFQKGESFYLKQNDSAFRYFTKAFDHYKSHNNLKDGVNSLIYISIILNDEGDYFGAEENSINAIKLMTNNNENLLSIYNEIAISRKKLKDYKSALIWYEKALRASNDSLEKIKIQNNIAVAFSKSKDYNKAIAILEGLSNQQEYYQDRNTQSKILDNLAFAKFLQNPNYNAETELKNALSIREKQKDLWGQNASHAHLSDYFYKNDKSKSLLHAQKMLSIAKELESPDDQLEALQKLILLETPENSRNYFIQYQKLNDSLQTARAKAKNQFALIRYETEKEKTENVKKQNHILKQNVVIGALVAGLFGGFFLYRRKQKRLRQEKEIEVKNTQIKYSKKVHDVVANGLYHTMMQMQNNPDFSKEQTLNEIEKMYEESRDISRDDLNMMTEKDFALQLSEMLNSYSSENQKVLIAGNNQDKWQIVSTKVQSEIYYVLREAMVNMKKHSTAKLILVKFERTESQLFIKYTDNGIGLKNTSTNSSSGIRNMENRIAAISGTIIFEENPKGGLIITISVPIK